MPHYIVSLKDQEICEFIGKHFNGGVVPDVNQDAYYVVTPDNGPNKIVGPAEYLDMSRDNFSRGIVFNRV